MNKSAERAFVDWLRCQGGCVHPGIELFGKLRGGQDRGVFAKADIKRGEQLLLIPRKLTLFIAEDEELKCNLCHEDLLKTIKGFVGSENLSPFLAAVLLFLGELALGEESEFHAYLQILPKDPPPSLITWTDGERSLLQGTSLEKNTDRNRFEDAFHKRLLALMLKHPQLWPSDQCGIDTALSVASIVQSRMFHMAEQNWITDAVVEGTTLHLIPGIDMINHSHLESAVNTELTLLKQNLIVDLEGQQTEIDGYFTMTADRDVAAGEEILLSYGNLGDAALLRIYGFITHDPTPNPHNSVTIGYDMIRRACDAVIDKQQWPVSHFEAKEAFLASRMCSTSQQLNETEIHLKLTCPLPVRLLTIVQVLLLSDDEFQEFEKQYEGDRSDPSLIEELEDDMGYIDESERSQMVLLTFLEVVSVLEIMMRRTEDHICEINRLECKEMATEIWKQEKAIVDAFKTEILSLMVLDGGDSDSSNTDTGRQESDSEVKPLSKKVKHN